MRNSNNGRLPWPLLTLSAIGVVSIIAIITRIAGKKKFGPLEKAADLIGRITQETREKLDNVVKEAWSHLSSDGSEGPAGLSELTNEFKEKLDAIAESMKNKIQAIREVKSVATSTEIHGSANT